MYSIEELVKIFEENAILCKEENDRLTEEFKEQNPGQPLPEWYTRDFCINTALASMCKEILHLKTLGNSEPENLN